MIFIDPKEISYHYRHYTKSHTTLPKNIKKNLGEMPNNKGYIYKNIRYYGQNPAQKGEPIILFERKREYLVIHEYTDTHYTVYHKEPNKKRKTISRVQRKQKII